MRFWSVTTQLSSAAMEQLMNEISEADSQVEQLLHMSKENHDRKRVKALRQKVAVRQKELEEPANSTGTLLAKSQTLVDNNNSTG
jgi:hypothetical protein